MLSINDIIFYMHHVCQLLEKHFKFLKNGLFVGVLKVLYHK